MAAASGVSGVDKKRILILGGTAEARELAFRLTENDALDLTLSLAGRTLDPRPQPVAVRTGGFGGAEGLADFLRAGGFDLLLDATHPFARRISANAEAAAGIAGVPLIRLERPGWEATEGDRWLNVGSITEAIAAFGEAPRRVFLAIGRQEAFRFSAVPQHFYLVRSIDPVDPPLDAPHVSYLLARGPFGRNDEIALLTRHRIDVVVSKNSGGEAAYGKIAAARSLGLPVIMIGRPKTGNVPVASSPDEMMQMVDHLFSTGRKRGV